MSLWRLNTMNLQELLRRLRAGESRNAIARALHVSPNTVKAYRRWAETQHLLEGALPDLSTLEALRAQSFGAPRVQRHPNVSSIESYRAEVRELLDQGQQPLTIWRLLKQRHEAQFQASPSAVYRMVRRLRAERAPEVTVRIESSPGEVSQVDFGFIGYLRPDEQSDTPRKAWVFVMTLGWSRHQYAEIVLDQSVSTWLLCHQHAFAFFKGVPQRVVIDNLKAAVIRAYTRDEDVAVQQSYRECAEHYGFLIDACLPRKPQHKGKVERGGVGYLKQSFVPLLPEGITLAEANQQLRHWLMHDAGLRVHGTTREVPLARFQHTEHAKLQSLPPAAYDPALWKQCKLHRDGHVVFEKAYYSVPHRLVGQTLWLRVGIQEIRVFTDDFQLVATHSRATQSGQRFTQPDHLPAHLAQALTLTRDTCPTHAAAIGSATAQVVQELLNARPVDRFRTALRVLRLAEEFTSARLEAACALGLVYGDTSLCMLKRILRERLDEPTPIAPTTDAAAESRVFARPIAELVDPILEGASWN